MAWHQESGIDQPSPHLLLCWQNQGVHLKVVGARSLSPDQPTQDTDLESLAPVLEASRQPRHKGREAAILLRGWNAGRVTANAKDLGGAGKQVVEVLHEPVANSWFLLLLIVSTPCLLEERG